MDKSRRIKKIELVNKSDIDDKWAVYHFFLK
jgi:hypothetical protein